MTTRELTPTEVADGMRGINGVDLSSTEIQALVRNMDASKKKWQHLKHKPSKYEAELKKENEMLYFNYPSLFQMHAEDRLDSTFFDMLQLKRKIEKGEMTPEQATKVVGEKLFKRFLPMQAGTEPAPKPMSYEDYYKQFSK
jgi:serine/threonine protein phosphatase PrpC